MSLVILPDSHPTLRLISEPVTEFNEELGELALEMGKTMVEARGIGLAAPQVGKSIRLIVVRLSYGYRVMVNPEFIRKLNRTVNMMEGCLSIRRALWRPIDRPAKCEVKWQNLEGDWFQENFSGLDARVVQHEIDHLDGILMNDLP